MWFHYKYYINMGELLILYNAIFSGCYVPWFYVRYELLVQCRTFPYHICNIRSRGSSGSIVSDYGLDDRAIEVRSPTSAEDFSSSPCVQTGSEAHTDSCPMGTGGPFPGGKARPGRDADHSPPSSGRG
jgi:hypothetical protein